jgi:ankyrin repeat protein
LIAKDQMFRQVAAGDLAGVQGAVERDSRLLEERDEYGHCPLAVTAYYGHLELVEYLAAQGAPLEARGNNGFTALLAAAQRGHHAVVRVLGER